MSGETPNHWGALVCMQWTQRARQDGRGLEVRCRLAQSSVEDALVGMLSADCKRGCAVPPCPLPMKLLPIVKQSSTKLLGILDGDFPGG